MNHVMESIGQQLKSARLQKGWTPEYAARQTKVRPEQLQALENDDYSKFPSLSYAKGFVRIYAKSLGLNDRKILAALNEKLEEDSDSMVTAPTVEYLPEGISSIPKLSPDTLGSVILWGMLISILFVSLYACGIWISNVLNNKPGKAPLAEKGSTLTFPKAQSVPKAVPVAHTVAGKSDTDIPVARAVPMDAVPNDPEARPAQPVVPVAEAVVPKAVPVNAGGTPSVAKALPVENTLVLTATESTGIKVLLVAGTEVTELYNDTLAANQSKSFVGAKFKLVLENASAVRINYNGTDAGTYSSDPVRAEFEIPATH
jgi:cytoskeletal protein RodZ